MPNGTCTSPPVAHSHTDYDGGMQSLAASYWPNDKLASWPTLHKTGVGDPTGAMAMNWGASSPAIDEDGATVTDHWSARYTGEISLPQTGVYGFQVYTDDGAVRLWLDDVQLIDAWTEAAGFRTGSTYNNTVAGSRHRLRLEFRDDVGNAQFDLHWIPPGGSTTRVPGANLFPRYGLPTTTTTDDSNGLPAQVTTTGYANPENGLPTAEVVDPSVWALSTTTAYEAPGSGWLRRTSKTLPAGTTTSYEYYGNTETVAVPTACPSMDPPANQAGLEKKTTGPDPTGADGAQVTELVHDKAGRVIASRRNAEVGWTCTDYDDRGRVDSVRVPAFGTQVVARDVDYNYAVGGDPLKASVTDPAGTITTETDLLGRVIRYTDVWGKLTATTYDQAGRVSRVVTPADTLDYAYDNSGRVTSVKLGGTTIAQAFYWDSGELYYVTFPAPAGNGTTVQFWYDQGGRRYAQNSYMVTGGIVTDVVSYSQAGRAYDETGDASYDAHVGNNFEYDGAGRLTRAWVGTAAVATHDYRYSYGAVLSGCGVGAVAGLNTNRTASTDNGACTTYAYDEADKLTSTSALIPSSPLYDSRGNTTTLGTQVLAYDGADRHVTTTGAATVTYTHDATDRIISRTAGGVTTRYSYSGAGDTPDLVLDGASVVVERSIGLPGDVTVTKRGSAATDVWSYPNVHGDITAVANGSGAKQGNTLAYDPFGVALGGLPDNSRGNLDYGWVGKHQRGLEHEGTLATIEMGARQYLPSLGRFLQVDPVEGGCANDYVYVFGDPVNQFDLDGRISNCGSLTRKPANPYFYAHIKRTGGGIDKQGNRYISYQLHFAIKRAHRWRARSSVMTYYYTSPITGKKHLNVKLNMDYWVHLTIRVRPGSVVGFTAFAPFTPAHLVGPNHFIHGARANNLQCVAR